MLELPKYKNKLHFHSHNNFDVPPMLPIYMIYRAYMIYTTNKLCNFQQKYTTVHCVLFRRQ